MTWCFGEFELDPEGFQLRRQSRPVKLERIPFELLTLLVERQGQLVSREEIAGRIWGDGVHVDVESGVNTAVRKLRAALKDSADQPAFVETVAGRGYRFLASVTKLDSRAVEQRPARTRRWRLAGLAVVACTAAAAAYFVVSRSVGPVPAAPVTIAVLPFQNLSGDPEQEYFGDGLTEETIAALGRVSPSRILVIAATSSMAYKRVQKTAAQIGGELGASYLVESSVRRDPQRVRITTKLIRVADQVQVWTATYDRAPAGLLGVQDEIGKSIARQVGAELSPPGELAARQATQDPDAHDLYLRGRYYWNQRTPDSINKSVEHFEAALQKDPSYALAYSGLADTYTVQTMLSGVNAPGHRNKVRLAIDRALSLNPNLAEAHTASGIANFFMNWDWAAAERSFRRAIELNPNYATAHQFYGHLLSNSLRHDEAIAEIQKARKIDPLSPMMHSFAGGFLVMAKRYDEALAPIQAALSIDRDFFPTHSVLGLLHQQTGKPDAAIEEYRTAYRLSRGNILQLANQGFVFGRTGRPSEAHQILATLREISSRRPVPPFMFAIVYSGLGDREAAFEWLEKAYEVRDIGLVFLPVDPKWDSLRSDRRFERLLRRCGFPG